MKNVLSNENVVQMLMVAIAVQKKFGRGTTVWLNEYSIIVSFQINPDYTPEKPVFLQ